MREQEAQQSNIRDNEHNVFPQGNHKWGKPHKFLRDRINTKVKPKTVRWSPDSSNLLSI